MSRLKTQILRIPQPLRFVMVGGTVAVLYLAGTLVLNSLGMPIQAAIPTAYVASLFVHFTLQRYFVFANHDEFALGLRHQVPRYLVTAAIQYAVTALLTAVLPDLLHANERLVYSVVAVAAAMVTYAVNRAAVFHAPVGPDVDGPAQRT